MQSPSINIQQKYKNFTIPHGETNEVPFHNSSASTMWNRLTNWKIYLDTNQTIEYVLELRTLEESSSQGTNAKPKSRRKIRGEKKVLVRLSRHKNPYHQRRQRLVLKILSPQPGIKLKIHRWAKQGFTFKGASTTELASDCRAIQRFRLP